MKVTKLNILFTFTALLCFFAAILLNLPIIIYLYLLVMLAIFLPYPKKIESLLFRLVCTFILSASLIQIIAMLFWLIKKPLLGGEVLLIHAIVLTVVYIYSRKRSYKISLISKNDLAALVPVVLFVLFFVNYGPRGLGALVKPKTLLNRC